MNPIAILSAIPQETDLLRSHMSGASPRRVGGRLALVGMLDGHDVVLAEAGVGKVNAALAAALLAERFRPRILLFSGVAGGLDPDLRIGDVVVAERTIQHDAGVLEGGGLTPYQAGHVPFFNPTERLGFVTNPDLLTRVIDRLAELRLEPVDGGRRPRIVAGTVLTGDQFLNDEATRIRLHREFAGSAIEMEGAALAQAAEQLGVDHLVIRALSDLAGAESDLDFGRFLDLVAANLAAVVRHLLAVL